MENTTKNGPNEEIKPNLIYMIHVHVLKHTGKYLYTKAVKLVHKWLSKH